MQNKEEQHMWYNARCAEAKRVKDRTSRKLKKQRNESNRERYCTMKQGMSMSG